MMKPGLPEPILWFHVWRYWSIIVSTWIPQFEWITLQLSHVSIWVKSPRGGYVSIFFLFSFSIPVSCQSFHSHVHMNTTKHHEKPWKQPFQSIQNPLNNNKTSDFEWFWKVILRWFSHFKWFPGDFPKSMEFQKRCFAGDVRSTADCDGAVQTALESYGALDILVNAAAGAVDPWQFDVWLENGGI